MINEELILIMNYDMYVQMLMISTRMTREEAEADVAKAYPEPDKESDLWLDYNVVQDLEDKKI